jgi:hypothetical protein
MKKAILALSVIAGLACTLVPLQNVDALSGSDFQAGRIIDDAVFFNGGTMSQGEIQSFLNSKVPVCDSGGTKPYGGSTRAAYGTSKGYPPPYTCMKDYWQGTPNKGAEAGLCNGFNGGDKPAAQIIYEVGQSCNVSQKALLVLLEKEQSLVTDDWPWSIQYRSATGYGCPDTAPCDAEYYGFFNQVYNAARQFKRYAKDSSLFRYRAYRENYIQYNPNAGCGGTNVNIQNHATAGLYNFTPYQPNPSALANLYGSGDGCGAYGNRNFWRIHNDWFGRTILDCQGNESPYAEVMRSYNPSTYRHFYTVYKCEVDSLSHRNGYTFEGTSFYQTSGSSPYAVVVHRLYNPSTHLHLWATSQEDINNATQRAGYRYEGVAYFVVKPEVPGHVPVHRLYNPKTYLHLWVTTQDEINSATQRSGYVYEGVAFYAAPPPAR